MSNYTYRRSLEEIRDLCASRKGRAEGDRHGFDIRLTRLPNGKKRDDCLLDRYCADRLAAAYGEIIMEIDVRLPAPTAERKRKAVVKESLTTATTAAPEPFDFGEDDSPTNPNRPAGVSDDQAAEIIEERSRDEDV